MLLTVGYQTEDMQLVRKAAGGFEKTASMPGLDRGVVGDCLAKSAKAYMGAQTHGERGVMAMLIFP